MHRVLFIINVVKCPVTFTVDVLYAIWFVCHDASYDVCRHVV